MEARVILKRSHRGINLRVQPAHALLDVGVNAVAKLARPLLLGLLGFAVERATVLQLPDAQVLEDTFPFRELETTGADVTRNLQAFR
jgi:hypothetical protein